MSARRAVPIGSCSGFNGDRIEAAREMVEGGQVDVLTGDYLAEVTALILCKTRQKNPQAGYARTFLTQMEHVLAAGLPLCHLETGQPLAEAGVKPVAENALEDT